MHNDFAVSLCSKLVSAFQFFPDLLVVVDLAVMLKHQPAVAAAKWLRAACAADYCKPGMPKCAFCSYLLELRLEGGNRVRFHNTAVRYKPGAVRPTVYHAGKHGTYQRHNVLTIFTQNTSYSTHFHLTKFQKPSPAVETGNSTSIAIVSR